MAGIGECPECGLTRRADAVKCQLCEEALRRSVPLPLLRRAKNVVLFGYQYRSAFEEDEKKGKEVHYYISPHDALVFVGAAILSGILGNVAYDVLKDVVKRLLRRLGRRREPFIDQIPKRLLQSEAELERFIQYVVQFHEGDLRGASPKVAEHVIHEVVTVARTHRILELMRDRPGADADVVVEAITDKAELEPIIVEILRGTPIDSDDAAHAWKIAEADVAISTTPQRKRKPKKRKKRGA